MDRTLWMHHSVTLFCATKNIKAATVDKKSIGYLNVGAVPGPSLQLTSHAVVMSYLFFFLQLVLVLILECT